MRQTVYSTHGFGLGALFKFNFRKNRLLESLAVFDGIWCWTLKQYLHFNDSFILSFAQYRSLNLFSKLQRKWTFLDRKRKFDIIALHFLFEKKNQQIHSLLNCVTAKYELHANKCNLHVMPVCGDTLSETGRSVHIAAFATRLIRINLCKSGIYRVFRDNHQLIKIWLCQLPWNYH